MRTTPKSDGRGTGRSDPPVVGDQVVPQGLVEVHAEAGNTIPTRVFAFTAGMIAPDKMQCVPERRYKLVSSGAERTYSPRTLFSRMKLMAARYCSALCRRSGSRGSNAAAFRGKRHNYVCRSICWLGVDQRGDKAYATDQKIRSEGEPLFTGE